MSILSRVTPFYFMNIIPSMFYIKRPLIFLCGPYYNDKSNSDRRKILLNYLLNNFRREKFTSCIPIIVDKIFDEKYIGSNNLNISLMEEITAAVSYRTYIFLDTMSTSFEFGQFINSKENNKIKVFLEDKYEKRRTCKIGSYIKESYKTNGVETIIYKRRKNCKGYTYFRKNIVPQEIANSVSEDAKSYFDGDCYLPIDYCEYGSPLKNVNSITYSLEGNKIVFNFNLKVAFYFVSLALTKSKMAITKLKINEDLLRFIITETKKYIWDIFIKKTRKYNIGIKTREISINIDSYKDSNFVLLHMLHFIFLISKANDRADVPKILHTELGTKIINEILFDDYKITDVLRLGKNELRIIDDYKRCPEKYAHKFKLKMHGKCRNLITYNEDYFGRLLRSIHEKIFSGLKSLLPSSNLSFAYKNGHNIMECLKKHKSSKYFIKMDITKYFENIKFKRLCSIIRETLKNDELKNFINLDDLERIISCCFYKYKMPIGFVTSPILSDIYLYSLDLKMDSPDFIYTRYADDIMISSLVDNLALPFKSIESFLKDYKLNLNDKTIKRTLIKKYDSIKFLGTNIVSMGNYNAFTISKKTLVKYSKRIAQYYNEHSNSYIEYSKVNGYTTYVFNSSKRSFVKLQKMVEAKCGILITSPLKENIIKL